MLREATKQLDFLKVKVSSSMNEVIDATTPSEGTNGDSSGHEAKSVSSNTQRQRPTAVIPMNEELDDEDERGWFHTECRPEKFNSLRQRSKRVSSWELTEQHKRQEDIEPSELTDAVDKDRLGMRPVNPDTGETNVMIFIMIKKIRRIEPIMRNVDIAFVAILRWRAKNLIGKRIDESKLWTPTISVINEDELVASPQTPWFYPKTGDVRQEIKFSGTICNEQNLSAFPFDQDDINLLFCCELGSGDSRARLAWDWTREGANLIGECPLITPPYVQNLLDEWTIQTDLNSVRRMPPLRNVTGQSTGIDVRVHVRRNVKFYITKIWLITFLVAASSFYCFFIRDNGVVGREAFDSRINFSAALLLTSVSFLYMSSDSIPKLNYLTLFDLVVMDCLLTILLVMLEAYVAFRVTEQGSSKDTIILIDQWSSLFIPVTFIAKQLGLMVYGFLNRDRQLKAVKKTEKGVEQIGVEECLLKHTRREEKSILKWYEKDEETIASRVRNAYKLRDKAMTGMNGNDGGSYEDILSRQAFEAKKVRHKRTSKLR